MAEVSTIPAYVLSNENLLQWMLRVPLSRSFRDQRRDYLRELVYVDFHRWNTSRPDHVFHHRWSNFCYSYRQQQDTQRLAAPFASRGGECSLVLACLECLKDEYIEFAHGDLHIRMDSFGWWQNMLSRMSSLPLLAHAIWRAQETHPGYAENEAVLPLSLYPYDEGVENYISRNGLNDSHLHVNLVAGAEICWLNALTFPDREWKEQQNKFDNIPEVVELYREVHVNLTPEVLHHRILIARRLRYLLQCYAKNLSICIRHEPGKCSLVQKVECLDIKLKKLREKREKEQRQKPDAEELEIQEQICALKKVEKEGDAYDKLSLSQYLQYMGDVAPDDWSREELEEDAGIPTCATLHGLFNVPDVEAERRWLSVVLEKLANVYDPLVDRALHLYVLLMNEFHTFYVQRDNMYGFKQFQKYSHTTGSVAKCAYYYDHVFRSLHGHGRNSVTNYAELRIAPHSSQKENEKRIGGILHGYYHYLLWVSSQENPGDTRNMDMDSLLQKLNDLLAYFPSQRRVVRPVIVLHLIKQRWSPECDKDDVRYAALRIKNKLILRVWQRLFEKYPLLRKWVRGIDAAADEMDTPPDVFAVAYRTARSVLGLRHATYHAGEDFYHLISGVRNIWDAVQLLEFQRGDRLGHATALGVNPQLWLATMPRCVTPTRGEWLQDLVFLWDLLHECAGHHEIARRLNRDILNLSYSIFHHAGISPHTLGRVFALRALDSDTLMNMYGKAENAVMEHLATSLQDTYLRAAPRNEEMVRLVSLHIAENPPVGRGHDTESLMVRRAFLNETPEVLSLLLCWLSDHQVWQRASVRCEVPADYLSVQELIFIQQQIQSRLTARGIVLETLPTSNLRISQYKEMGQHHSLRWLGIGAYEGDSPPPIVLGTDDPGIFATDIKGEFYHLFASLCKRGLNAQAALNLLAEVNENGNRYAFRTLVENDTEYSDERRV